MKAVPVFYDPRMQAVGVDSVSPSAAKPAKAVRSWIEGGYPVDIRPFNPAPLSLLYRVHDAAYVDGVLTGIRMNGFRNRSASVAASLPWTTGSMVAAARAALRNGQVACSPTSGFHHALRNEGSKFCTFNGLIAAVLAVLDDDPQRRVGILDLDAHYADGTVDVLAANPHVAARVEHYNFGGDLPSLTVEAVLDWLPKLPELVDGMASRCDLVLYQAGADPHIDDPLGGLMTSEQMRERDRMVFQACAKRVVPIAWNLAGGYQEPFDHVLALHDATMEECVSTFVGRF